MKKPNRKSRTMSSCASFFFLFLFSFLSSFRASAQNPTFLHSSCPNTATYSKNSTYYNNLKTILNFLSSRNASHSTGFQNATSGQGPDKVTGLFLCRGDVSLDVCRNCVTFSVDDALTRCPTQREAVLYYDECMLRYSNQSILSNLETSEPFSMSSNIAIVPKEQEGFRNLVLSIMNDAATEAASSSRKFGARNDDFTAFQSVYGLVQCTPDLTTQECSRCLKMSIYQLPTANTGARVLLLSCNSRYESYPFYNESAAITFPSRPGKDSSLVVAIVVPIMVVVLLFIAGYCFLSLRSKRTYETAPTFNHGDDVASIDSLELDNRTIQAATNYYSEDNKIGQGGFGEVCKGKFSSGTEVEVKRLLKSSEQGDTEFKNE